MGTEDEPEDGSAEEASSTPEEAVEDEPASDGKASDEAASDEAASDEAASDEAASDEAASDEAASDEAAADKPRKKKRSKKKKRRKKRSETDADGVRAKKKRPKKKRPKTDDGEEEAESEDSPKRRIPWLAIILTIAVVELFLFGSRGRIQICVAKEGVHDFDLLGTPRTDDNTARYPSCETRLNIGMKSQYDDLKTDAVVHACRRANMFRGKEAILTCAIEADGWKHRVQADFVKPWEPEYRKRLFWFLD